MLEIITNHKLQSYVHIIIAYIDLQAVPNCFDHIIVTRSCQPIVLGGDLNTTLDSCYVGTRTI